MLTMLMATIPDPDPLPMPAPPWLLWALLILTFTLHILAMNFVLGGSIITAVARVRGGEHSMRLARSFGKAMPTVIATAVTFGVAPLLFLQALYGRLFFSSAVLMAWWWFAVVPLVILAYYGAYTIAFRAERSGWAALAVAIALIFIGIAFIYANNMTLMLRPEKFLPMYVASGGGTHLNAGDATLVPRYLHMLFGAIAVAGMVVSLYGVAKKRNDAEHGDWAIGMGLSWFVSGTIANAATGLWWMAMLPKPVLLRFMGQSPAATIALTGGIVFGLIALVLMVLRRPMPAASLLVLSLVGMVLARDEVRAGMFELMDFRITQAIAPQWDVIAIFAVLLVAALAVTGWMMKIVLQPVFNQSKATSS